MSTPRAGSIGLPDSAPLASAGFALTTLLKRVGIALAILLALVGLLSFWLLRTESGLQFVLARAIGATDGKLTIGKSSGNLAGSSTIEDLRYHDPVAGLDVHARHTTIAFAPLELFSSRLHLTRLQLDGVDVALTSVSAPPRRKRRANSRSPRRLMWSSISSP